MDSRNTARPSADEGTRVVSIRIPDETASPPPVSLKTTTRQAPTELAVAPSILAPSQGELEDQESLYTARREHEYRTFQLTALQVQKGLTHAKLHLEEIEDKLRRRELRQRTRDREKMKQKKRSKSGHRYARSLKQVKIQAIHKMEDEMGDPEMDILDGLILRFDKPDKNSQKSLRAVTDLRRKMLKRIVLIQSMYRGWRRWKRYQLIRRSKRRMMNRIVYAWKWYTWTTLYYRGNLKRKAFYAIKKYERPKRDPGCRYLKPPIDKCIIVRENGMKCELYFMLCIIILCYLLQCICFVHRVT
jgi:hypothetical protein